MKIKVPGEMSVADMRQCIMEQLNEMTEAFNVRYVRGINLYFTPTDGKGNEVVCKTPLGKEVTQMESEGKYMSAADTYEI